MVVRFRCDINTRTDVDIDIIDGFLYLSIGDEQYSIPIEPDLDYSDPDAMTALTCQIIQHKELDDLLALAGKYPSLYEYFDTIMFELVVEKCIEFKRWELLKWIWASCYDTYPSFEHTLAVKLFANKSAGAKRFLSHVLDIDPAIVAWVSE